MKLVIIEGLDNCGKSTYISWLRAELELRYGIDPNRINVIHFNGPDSTLSLEDQAKYMNNYNNTLCNNINKLKAENAYDYVILDRSWYSEYVYGQIYRKRDKKDILNKNLKFIELGIMWNFDYDDITFIYLHPSNLQFLINHEDGLSLSKKSNDDMLALLKKEEKLFKEVLKYSLLPEECKCSIVINENNNYINHDDIVKKIMKGILR